MELSERKNENIKEIEKTVKDAIGEFTDDYDSIVDKLMNNFF